MPNTPKAHYSQGPMLPRPITPKVQYSQGPKLPRPITSRAYYSQGLILPTPITPEAHYSQNPLLPKNNTPKAQYSQGQVLAFSHLICETQYFHGPLLSRFIAPNYIFMTRVQYSQGSILPRSITPIHFFIMSITPKAHYSLLPRPITPRAHYSHFVGALGLGSNWPGEYWASGVMGLRSNGLTPKLALIA